jgi:hypothetical protein
MVVPPGVQTGHPNVVAVNGAARGNPALSVEHAVAVGDVQEVSREDDSAGARLT